MSNARFPAGRVFVTGVPEADRLLSEDPLALLVGMLLDQQIPIERAFLGPWTLSQRLGDLDAVRIAGADVEVVVEAACERPAIHRFPAVMARRIHAMCVAVVEDWDGDPARIWTAAPDAPDAATVARRLRALPGFGPEKAAIMVAVLAKRCGVRPDGWEQVAGVFADDQPRTVADCGDPAGLAAVREWKTAQKAAGRDKQGRPLTR